MFMLPAFSDFSPANGRWFLQDQAALEELASQTWPAEPPTDAGAAFGEAAAAWPALPDGRMPFQLLAAALELGTEARPQGFGETNDHFPGADRIR